MSSQTYYEGKDMESNVVLHDNLIKILNFDKIEVRGGKTTKADVVGIVGTSLVPISIKYGRQANTQVHLPTLKSFAKATAMPTNVYSILEQWLGVTSQIQFESWFNGNLPNASHKKYKRLFASDIASWKDVIDWFNNNNREIAQLLLQAMNCESPAKYLVWVHKNKNTFQIVDIDLLIDWITTDCSWVTGSRNNGSTIRCEATNGKPIFHLQMKGSGGTPGEYNHNPQFHIHINWPESTVIHQGKFV